MNKIYNEPGTISPIFEEPQYFSERGLPLITQYITDFNEQPHDMLTMENYEKWYYMHIIRKDGTVERISQAVIPDDPHDYGWIDHAVKPYAFHKTAMGLGLKYDNRTFALVCERFVEDALDGDWSKLCRYLPKED